MFPQEPQFELVVGSVQVGAEQVTVGPGATHAAPVLPSDFEPQIPLPGQGVREAGAAPAGETIHLPAALQVSHCPPQVVSQQTPSAQKSLVHSAPVEQGAPSGWPACPPEPEPPTPIPPVPTIPPVAGTPPVPETPPVPGAPSLADEPSVAVAMSPPPSNASVVPIGTSMPRSTTGVSMPAAPSTLLAPAVSIPAASLSRATASTHASVAPGAPSSGSGRCPLGQGHGLATSHGSSTSDP